MSTQARKQELGHCRERSSPRVAQAAILCFAIKGLQAGRMFGSRASIARKPFARTLSICAPGRFVRNFDADDLIRTFKLLNVSGSRLVSSV